MDIKYKEYVMDNKQKAPRLGDPKTKEQKVADETNQSFLGEITKLKRNINRLYAIDVILFLAVLITLCALTK